MGSSLRCRALESFGSGFDRAAVSQETVGELTLTGDAVARRACSGFQLVTIR